MKSKHLYKCDDGKVVHLRFRSDSGNFMIVSLPGDLDMQSQWGIPPSSEVEEIPYTALPDGVCPACGKRVTPLDLAHASENAEMRQFSHLCTCGWIGWLKKDG